MQKIVDAYHITVAMPRPDAAAAAFLRDIGAEELVTYGIARCGGPDCPVKHDHIHYVSIYSIPLMPYEGGLIMHNGRTLAIQQDGPGKAKTTTIMQANAPDQPHKYRLAVERINDCLF